MEISVNNLSELVPLLAKDENHSGSYWILLKTGGLGRFLNIKAVNSNPVYFPNITDKKMEIGLFSSIIPSNPLIVPLDEFLNSGKQDIAIDLPVLDSKSSCQLKASITHSVGKKKDVVPSTESSTEVRSETKDRKYLRESEMDIILSSLVESLLKEKPQKPIDFAINFLSRKSQNNNVHVE